MPHQLSKEPCLQERTQVAATEQGAETNSGSPKRIAFYGLFGQQNWGNECTLQAVLHNARRYVPGAELACFCTDPQDTVRRHKIRAYPVVRRYAKGYSSGTGRESNVLIRVFRRLLVGVPVEAWSWIKGCARLRGADMLVVAGTGLLTDFTSNPFGIPYRILKWSLIAKVCRCKLLFVSVGAGPMYHPLTRLFMKLALSLADYRSYRDAYSRQFLVGIGFNAQADRLYPDLAFSLPPLIVHDSGARGRRTVVGLGVKDYYGKLGLPENGGGDKYHGFVRKLAAAVSWLFENNYIVRLLIGDSLYDNQVKEELISLIPGCQQRIQLGDLISCSISSVDDLVAELALTDIVVSARFHNILLALMLNKLAVSLSYHEKFESLMAGAGLKKYCHDIDNLDVDELTRQIVEIEHDSDNLRPIIKQRVDAYRVALDEQYERIFGTTTRPVPDRAGGA
jgi:polysaccharide pyruvyl transferase WcaK-like protein